MANFQARGKLTTKLPKVKVDAGLPVGKHRFRLTVIDRSGRLSLPGEIVVNIVKRSPEPAPGRPGLGGPVLRRSGIR